MNKPFLILPLLFMLCGTASLSVSAATPFRVETILFSATGFTNKSGKDAEQNDRAIDAARYLVIKKIERLFTTAEGTQVVLPAGWADTIRILNTIPIETTAAGNLHAVRLIGKVSFELAENSPSADMTENGELLETSFASSKHIYYSGEEISFRLSGNKDFFACILDINERKEAIQLLPNAFRQNNTFSGGKGYIFPDAESGDGFRLEVSPPYGKETIRLIASSYPIATILPISGQEVFATSSRTFQELMLPVYDEMTDSLMETGNTQYFQFIHVSTKALSLKTEAEK